MTNPTPNEANRIMSKDWLGPIVTVVTLALFLFVLPAIFGGL